MTVDTIAAGRDGMTGEDRELVLRAQQGQADAHAELLRRHRRMVVSVVYGILGCRDEAEDAAQETIVKAYRSIGSYRLQHPYTAWLRRIAVNTAVSRLRQQSRERRRDEVELTREDPGSTVSPHERVADAERNAHVRSAVEALPLRQRLAVTLFHLQDMTLADTADAMGCSVGAVKAHLHRGREALAVRLSSRLKEADL